MRVSYNFLLSFFEICVLCSISSAVRRCKGHRCKGQTTELPTSTIPPPSEYPSREYKQWIEDRLIITTTTLSPLELLDAAYNNPRLKGPLPDCSRSRKCDPAFPGVARRCECCRWFNTDIICEIYVDQTPVTAAPAAVKIDGFCPRDGYPNCDGCTGESNLEMRKPLSDLRCCMHHHNAWKNQISLRQEDPNYYRDYLSDATYSKDECTGESSYTLPKWSAYIPWSIRSRDWPTTTTRRPPTTASGFNPSAQAFKQIGLALGLMRPGDPSW